MLSGVLAGLAAGALWGLVFLAPRLAPGLSSLDLTAGRFVSYGLVSLFSLGVLARRAAVPGWRQAGAALGLSLLGFTGYYWLLVLAIRDAGIEVPTLIIGTIPLWVMLLGKPEHLDWRGLLPGFALTAVGLALMVAASWGGELADRQPHFVRGVLLAVAAMASWTLFSLLNSAWLRRHADVGIATWSAWLGVATGLGALALWSALGSPWNELGARADFARSVAVCVVTGVGAAWLATILWNHASRRLPASLCGQLIVSETVFALLYAFGWEGRWPSALEAGAAGLFTLGILLSIRAHR